MYKVIRLKRGKDESLRRFHPWVFSGAIANIEEGVSEGDVVRVLTHSGDFIAVGHYKCPCSTHPNYESGRTNFCQITFEF